MKHRYKLVREYRARRRTCSEKEAARQTAERFQCSLRSVRRFASAFRQGGKIALLPNYQLATSPSQTTLDPAVVEIVLAFRAKLGWCGQRIARELAARHLAQTSHMTIYRLLRRYHVPVRTYHPVGRSAGIGYRRQRVRGPNWVWHIDFAGPWQDQDDLKRSIVVVIDAYSRMLLALEVVEHQSSEAVETVLEALFTRYGKPKVLISDNGRAFAPSKAQQNHRFHDFLRGHGIEHRRVRPYYPQTNGKVEAAIKTIEREFLARLDHQAGQRWLWAEVSAGKAQFQGWYNFYRAHSALGYEVPAARYAGIRLAREGLANLFGFLPESQIEVASLPDIRKNNRMDGLRLMLLVA